VNAAGELHVEAEIAGGADAAEGLQVGHHEEGRRPVRLVEHLGAEGDGLAAAVATEGDPCVVDRDRRVAHRLSIAGKAIAPGGESERIRERVADIADAAMAELDQMPGREIGAMDVVGPDIGDGTAHAAERHRRDMRVPEQRRLDLRDLQDGDQQRREQHGDQAADRAHREAAAFQGLEVQQVAGIHHVAS